MAIIENIEAYDCAPPEMCGCDYCGRNADQVEEINGDIIRILKQVSNESSLMFTPYDIKGNTCLISDGQCYNCQLAEYLKLVKYQGPYPTVHYEDVKKYFTKVCDRMSKSLLNLSQIR